MALTNLPGEAQQKAAALNEAGLKAFADWEMDKAIESFKQAAEADPENPEYFLNLARAYARSGSYPDAMRSLGKYLHVEKDEEVAERFEWLFSSTFDKVESSLMEGTQRLDLPMQLVSRAIRMWLEYRLTVGRRPLEIKEPDLWAASLTYLICKINLYDIDRVEVASAYGVSLKELKETCNLIVKSLDLIPADYRYFTGDENPLDKVFEAARQLESFYQEMDEDDQGQNHGV
jgi:tetratricopeptide (TPR) repeat protein